MFYPIITTFDRRGGRAGINKNVTYLGSQLTFLDGGGGAGQE